MNIIMVIIGMLIFCTIWIASYLPLKIWENDKIAKNIFIVFLYGGSIFLFGLMWILFDSIKSIK